MIRRYVRPGRRAPATDPEGEAETDRRCRRGEDRPADVQMLLPFGRGEDARSYGRAAIRAFLAAIPEDVRAALQPFRERHWHLLQLAARCPGALDLIRESPALAWCLASSWSFRSPVAQPLRSARSLVRKRRREILRWLGFRATEGCRRVMEKVPHESLSVTNLLNLRDLMRSPEVCGRLHHLPEVNLGVLTLLHRPRLRAAVSMPMLLAAAKDPRERRRPERAWHLSRIQELDAAAARGIAARGVATADELQRIRLDLEQRMDREALSARLALRFPGAPFAGDPWVRPLATPRALRDEGRTQHHCVFSLAEDVAKGDLYVYHVHAERPATLSLRREGKAWSLDAFRGPCNADPTPEAVARVASWLERQEGLPGSEGWELDALAGRVHAAHPAAERHEVPF